MKPAPFDLSVTRGDDFILLLALKTRQVDGTKVPVDLTGYTVESKFITRDNMFITVSATFTDRTAGSVKLVLSRSVTGTLPLSGVKWYFALTDPSDEMFSYVDGSVYVRDRGAKVR